MSANETQTQPTTVKATLEYFVPPKDGSKPWQFINADPTTGVRPSNFTRQSYELEIENLRASGGKEDTVSLDTAGFQFANAPAKHKSFANDEEIQREYYPESEELLKKLTGASRVVFFDHSEFQSARIDRNSVPDIIARYSNPPPPPRRDRRRTQQAPTRPSRPRRPNPRILHRPRPPTPPPSDAPNLLSRRFQIINLWRPINHIALDHPLALCDYRSINLKEDLVPTTLKYPDRDGETYGVKYNPNHKWKYVRGMTPDEVVLIKCYDSIDDGSVAVLTPHTAFNDPTTPPDAPLRESIELRSLVFYD